MSRIQLKPYYSVKIFFFFEKSAIEVFFREMLSTPLAENALSKENTVVFVTRNDRNTVRNSTTHSGARRAIQSANRVHIIISQAVHLEQLFFVFLALVATR